MEEFNLADTKRFLIAKGCAHYSNKSIVDTYMAIGGVAKYLQALDCSKNPSQALQELTFSRIFIIAGCRALKR